MALGITGLAGCGGSQSAAKAATGSGTTGGGQVLDVSHALALAADSTRSMDSARTSLVEKVGGVTITGSGLASWKPLAMDITMHMPAAAGSAGGATEVRMVNGVMYMNMQNLPTAQAFGGKHWLKMDLAALAQQQGGASAQMLGNMSSQSGHDPAQSVALITSSPGVKRIGTETVDGVQATHYQGTVDVAKLDQSSLGGLTASQRSQLEQQLTQSGVSSLTVDVWVDSRNLPVRMHEAGQAAKGPMDVTADYSDYGTPVNVQVPPASDTVDMAAMMKQAGAGAS